MRVRGIILSFSTIFLLNDGNVLTVWYFHFIHMYEASR